MYFIFAHYGNNIWLNFNTVVVDEAEELHITLNWIAENISSIRDPGVLGDIWRSILLISFSFFFFLIGWLQAIWIIK